MHRVKERRQPALAGSDLERRLLARLAEPQYQPEEAERLADALGHPRAKLEAFRDLLRDLERRGRVGRVRKTRYVLPRDAGLFTGRFAVGLRGHGRVTDETTGEELFVPADQTGTALHGDRVVARIERPPTPGSRRSVENRPVGRILRILDRSADRLVGTVRRTREMWYVVPDDPRFPHRVRIGGGREPIGGRRLQAGDKVVVRLLPWESRSMSLEGEMVEVLGPADSPGVETLSLLRRFGIPETFSEEVLAEADRIPEAVDAAEIQGREDFRSFDVVTIDPDDARDFDDAIHVERAGDGWILQVHIADVAHYVKPGSALDREAARRGNSVYLPERVVPMLPERLSNGICSLCPGSDRLVCSVLIRFDRLGRRRSVRFVRGVIRSARRFTYREAWALLQRPPCEPLARMLHRAWELASRLRERRFEHGALALDFPEIKVRVDPVSGRALGLERIENDTSHQLVEECMLAANEAVAHALRTRQIPALYRVHEPPLPEKLAEFRAFLATLGHAAGDLTQREELVRVLLRVCDLPESPAIRLALLRSLMRARYDPSPIGHYGLAKADYTHFTSPIRRYSDLLTHRALTALLDRRAGAGREQPRSTELASLAEHLSACERVAAEVEQVATERKKLEYLAFLAAEKPNTGFEAVVTEVRQFGLFVSVPDFALSGLVHVSTLADDFYLFDAGRGELCGRVSGRRFRAGTQVRVTPIRVNFLTGEVDYRVLSWRDPTGGRSTAR